MTLAANLGSLLKSAHAIPNNEASPFPCEHSAFASACLTLSGG